MATATSRISLDPPPSLIDIPSIVDPRALPNHHVRLPDLPHSQPRRVSSESHTSGRSSPSPRLTRRPAVPFLLEAFPAPPSHIPGTPSGLSPGSLLSSPSILGSTTSWLSGSASPVSTSQVSPTSTNGTSPCSPKSVAATLPHMSHSNPPPSSPPTGPLPPIPGPSSVTSDLIHGHRALQTAARSASPALSMAESHRSQSRPEQRPRTSTDTNDSMRGRSRQGSLSSLRSSLYPLGERSETIAEEPAEASYLGPSSPVSAPPSPPLFGSVAERPSQVQSRSDGPDALRSSRWRVITTPVLQSDDKPCAEESIARVDISDLNALKMDNEGDGEDQGLRQFPQFPPLPHHQPQSPSDHLSSAPSHVRTPRKPNQSSVDSVNVSTTAKDTGCRPGATSPEITRMISATPRPRKRSGSSRSRESSCTRNRQDSSRSRKGIDAPPLPTRPPLSRSTVGQATRRSGDEEAVSGGEDGNDSDSSLDLHTPLPELMLRHGMLSPNSKLLPQTEEDSMRLSMMSTASNLSLKSTASTSSKLAKDARDTVQRRVRHRDGKLLKGGIGLTTGLGWSDSEDEDAPSALTRRVSTLVLSRRDSTSSFTSSRTTRSASSVHPLSRSISHSILREADEYEAEAGPDEFGYSSRSSIGTRSLPSSSKPISRVGSARSVGSSIGRQSAYSTSIRAPTVPASESSVYTPSDKVASTEGHAGLMPGISEHDDGITPTRAAFERTSLGSLNGSAGADPPHTPSSTASSLSLPFPATPESAEQVSQPQSMYSQDKGLPPLPPGLRGKYPSTVSLRSQSSALQRPRTTSTASSLSNSSMRAVPSRDVKSNTTSAVATPRPSLSDRPTNAAIPGAIPPPSLNGTPRPTLIIPKSPFPSQSTPSGLPRPTTPSSTSSAKASQGYAPRPLRLASRSAPLPSPIPPTNAPPFPPPDQVEVNRSPAKDLQPGEQLPRPGQILTYNRNIHDQLKLRALSLSTGPNRSQALAVSPGGTQTMFMPSTGVTSGPSSPSSTPVTARSQSPLPSPGGDGVRPRPRTGTGMMYRNNLSVGSATASRIRPPSTVSR